MKRHDRDNNPRNRHNQDGRDELAFEQRSPFAWVARVGEYHFDRYLIMKTRGDWRLTYPGYQFHNVTAPTREQCEEAAREHYAKQGAEAERLYQAPKE